MAQGIANVATRPGQMSYQFNNNKNLGKQAVTLLRGQVRKAQSALEQYEADPAESVHRARQRFKRCRSLVHLVAEHDPYMFAVEKRFFKNMGKHLAAARDQDAMHEALERLTESPPAKNAAAISALRKWFAKMASDTHTSPAENRTAVYTVLQSLDQAQQRYKLLKLSGLRREHLLSAVAWSRLEFKRYYRDACLQETPAAYHEWRKVTKRLCDQLRLCASLDHSISKQNRRQLAAIAETLGHHQDTVVMYERFRAYTGYVAPDERKQIILLFEGWMRADRMRVKEQTLSVLGAASRYPHGDDHSSSNLQLVG